MVDSTFCSPALARRLACNVASSSIINGAWSLTEIRCRCAPCARARSRSAWRGGSRSGSRPVIERATAGPTYRMTAARRCSWLVSTRSGNPGCRTRGPKPAVESVRPSIIRSDRSSDPCNQFGGNSRLSSSCRNSSRYLIAILRERGSAPQRKRWCASGQRDRNAIDPKRKCANSSSAPQTGHTVN